MCTWGAMQPSTTHAFIPSSILEWCVLVVCGTQQCVVVCGSGVRYIAVCGGVW